MRLEALKLRIEGGIAHVELNRPDKSNAMNRAMWDELRSVFRQIDAEPEARVAVLSAAGKNFTAGMDLSAFGGLLSEEKGACPARKREAVRLSILDYQDVITTLEKCRKPVLAAIHGACYGGGVDLTSAADMRYATTDASFCIKETDLAIVADVGTLQRLPKLIGDGMARELAYTARPWSGEEALAMGYVNRCYPTREAMLSGVIDIARQIASKSPLTIRGTKQMILYARDHTVADSLDYMAAWNAGMLISEDTGEAFAASREKRAGRFKG
jgi:enoyl-CoA hydratase